MQYSNMQTYGYAHSGIKEWTTDCWTSGATLTNSMDE